METAVQDTKPSCGPSVACLTLALGLSMLASLNMIGAVAVRECRDSHGNLLLDSAGQPLTEIDDWATWKINWFSNSLLIIAGLFVLFAVLLGIRMILAHTRK